MPADRQRAGVVRRRPAGSAASSSARARSPSGRAARAARRAAAARAGAAASVAVAHPGRAAARRRRRRRFAPLAVMGIGSWPRPRWMLQAMHEHLEGRLADDEFQATADDAVRLAVAAQLRAGVDVVTDGEQRRDNYASFVGGRLDNCQLIPLTDLLPLVDDPEKFAARAAGARRARRRGPPSGGVRAARAQPAAGRARARVRAHADRPAGQGRAARPVSADADDVAGVHLRPRLPLARGPGRGRRARPARGARTSCSPPARRSSSSTSRC